MQDETQLSLKSCLYVEKNIGKINIRNLANIVHSTPIEIIQYLQSKNKLRVKYTTRELQLLLDHYDGKDSNSITALAELLHVSRYKIKYFARVLKINNKREFWTKREDAYIRKNINIKSYKQIGDVLNRSSKACEQRARILGIIQKNHVKGYMLVKQVASIFGLSNKHIYSWLDRKYINTVYTEFALPKYLFTEENIEEFIRNYPYLYFIHLMPGPSYFKTIAIDVWKKDPFLRTTDIVKETNMTEYALIYNMANRYNMPVYFGIGAELKRAMYVKNSEFLQCIYYNPKLQDKWDQDSWNTFLKKMLAKISYSNPGSLQKATG